MTAFLIRTIDLTATGREIVRDRSVETDALAIGRAAENHIHLPDLAVEQHHAVIEPMPGGQLKARALGSLGFAHDGRVVGEALFDPREGRLYALAPGRPTLRFVPTDSAGA